MKLLDWGWKGEYFHLRRGRGERVIVSSDFKKLLNVLLKKSYESRSSSLRGKDSCFPTIVI